MELTLLSSNLLKFLVSHLKNTTPGNPQTYLNYKFVHDGLKLDYLGPTWGESLEKQGLADLANWTYATGFPGITGLIIDKNSLEPGKGYFKLYNKLNSTDYYSWWNNEIKKAKGFDWSEYILNTDDLKTTKLDHDYTIRECIAHITSSYLSACSEDFTKHPIANFLRHKFPETLESIVGKSDTLIFKGSAGQGQWVRGPWVAIFDCLVTRTAEQGFYPVYLFREDVKGVYLSLNQAMTEAKVQYKSDAKTALKARATNYRAMLGSNVFGFTDDPIDLSSASDSNSTSYYEAGNILSKYYPADTLPSEDELTRDLISVLNLYSDLIIAKTNEDSITSVEGDEPPENNNEDATKFRLHKRIERNSSLIKRVKDIQGYTCKVCGINFEDKYGATGKEFIEAHHLKPLSSLKGTKIKLDPLVDFAVLCSNCHRMVHRSGLFDNIEEFKKNIYLG